MKEERAAGRHLLAAEHHGRRRFIAIRRGIVFEQFNAAWPRKREKCGCF